MNPEKLRSLVLENNRVGKGGYAKLNDTGTAALNALVRDVNILTEFAAISGLIFTTVGQYLSGELDTTEDEVVDWLDNTIEPEFNKLVEERIDLYKQFGLDEESS